MDDLERISSSDFQSESWSTTTVYDAVFENDNTDNEAVNAVPADKVDEIDNANEQVYEEYDGDCQEIRSSIKKFAPRYATYSNESDSIIKKILKKKMLVVLVFLVLCTVGVAVGLSVHFTQPTTTTVSTTTTVRPIETTSTRGCEYGKTVSRKIIEF